VYKNLKPKFSEEVVQKFFNFEKFFKFFKAISSGEKKKTRRVSMYDFYMKLYNELLYGTYTPGNYTCFVVKDPNPREIFASHFDDRIIHHLIVDILFDIQKDFIEDSYANQKGKGTHKAIKKLQYYMRQIPQRDCYYMQCDIKSYFASINKNILFGLIFEHIEKLNFNIEEKKFITFLLNKIILQNPTHNVKFSGDTSLLKLIPKEKSLFGKPNYLGLPLGCYTSQFEALIYLNLLDYYVKDELDIKFYIRYVDDFVILSNNPKEFIVIKEKINNFLQTKLQLSLHPNKTKIQNVSKGINFLGYIIRPHYLLIRKRTVNNFKQRLEFFNWLLDKELEINHKIRVRFGRNKISKYFCEGFISKELNLPMSFLLRNMINTINSYYGMFSFANTYNLRKMLYIKYFKHLKEYFYPKNSFRCFGLKPIFLITRGVL